MASKPIKILLQYTLPQHKLSRFAGFLANNRKRVLKNYLIRWFIQRYQVNMQEAIEEDPYAYPTFNHFFTRGLKPALRPIAVGNNVVSSPVDGVISQIGNIEDDRIFQAKGRQYTLSGLLAKPQVEITEFVDGQFATLYLAPHDYHRIHLPITGRLKEMHYVPGQLFSVNPQTAINIDNLFARNERVICWFEAEFGTFAVVLVGAMIVANIFTTWHGQVNVPAKKSMQVTHWDYHQANIILERGKELGHFQLGSTVILLFPKDSVCWHERLKAGASVKMGEEIGWVIN